LLRFAVSLTASLAAAQLALLPPGPPLQVQARPVRGGVGGPASGAGVRPGAGWGAPGAGLTPAPGVGAGGVGGPASGAGVRPGAGWGAPGVGLTRAPAAAYGAAVYHPGWAGGGYWAARPWPYGWYGARPLAWWGAAAVATSTAAVTRAVDAATAAQTVWIAVPQTALQLNYASVQAVGDGGVRFSYLAAGGSYSASGDCRNGLVNGTAAQGDAAQLLHAACQVAYGAGG
jgi:hypothetical protein